MTENAVSGVPILVGRVGEDEVTAIVFDASAWVAEYGAGSFALVVRRPGEAVGLPVTITEANGVVTWAPTSYDTEKRGGGEAQLVYTPIGKTKKSEIWPTYVSPSLTSPVAPPSSFVGWVDEVIAAAASITNMGATAETIPAGDPAAVTKTVDPETGTVTLTFGIPAGEKGDQGAPGRGVSSVSVTETGEWIITYTDGSSETVGHDVYSAILALAERAEDAQTAAERAQRGAEAAQGAAERAQGAAEGAVQDAQLYAAQAIDAAAAADDSAEDAEAYAVGKRGGEDVPDTDPAYHNNAKYYAGQASGAASAADDSAEDAEAYAVGKRNGADVESSDPAYHNNAKYYAGQAGASAEAAGSAKTAAETAEDHAEEWATGGTGGTPSASNNAKKYAEDAADSAAAAAASAATLTLDGTLTQAGQAAQAKAAGDGIRDTQGMIAPREATSTASQNYAVGDYLVYNGKLYKVTAAIANGETITPGTNTEITDVASELASGSGGVDESALTSVEPWYTGTNLATKFADEITSYGGDPWAWIKARITAGNFSGIHVNDYIPITTMDNKTLNACVAGINTYKGYGNTGYKVGNHIDFITRETYGTKTINPYKYNNGLIPLATITGDGTTTSFVLAKQMNNVSSVKQGSTTLTGWTYDPSTFTLTFQEAPAEGSITVTGTGTEYPWLACDLYHWLNSLSGQIPNSAVLNPAVKHVDYTQSGAFYNLPSSLKSVIVQKRLYIAKRYNATSLLSDDSGGGWTDIGKLWLPTEEEVFGRPIGNLINYNSGRSVQYPIFALSEERRIKKQVGSVSNADPVTWWLLNTGSGSTERWCAQTGNGTWYLDHTNNSPNRSPICFRIA